MKTASFPRVLSAGIVPVRSGDNRFLVLRAYRNWDFPKGIVEPDESPFEAACREFREETGLTELRFPWGNEHRDTEPYSRGKVVRFYVSQTIDTGVKLLANPETGKPEHHEYRWVTEAEARALLPSRLLPILSWAQNLINDAH